AGARAFVRRSAQGGQRRAEVQVERGVADHERGHGFHARGLGFGNTVFIGAQVDDPEIDLGRIEMTGERGFGLKADGASGVIECGGGFHGVLRVGGRGSPTVHGVYHRPDFFTEGAKRWVGTVLCPLDYCGCRAQAPPVMKSKHLSLSERAAYRSLEDVVGCKWSAAVVGALSRGVNRPGRLERYIPGISTKVLTERLRRLVDYGLATRIDCSQAVLHVEYRLTAKIGRAPGRARGR